MATRKLWVIEEVGLEDGGVAHRQSEAVFIDNTDESWAWVCPSDRLDAAGQAEWTRVLNALKNVDGEDMRHLVCGIGLMDHCNHPGGCDPYSD
jgi:hypothetical protein